MKAILSYNEEYNDVCVVETFPDGADALGAFREHVTERVMQLLDATPEEAEAAVSGGETDGVSYNEHGGLASATVDYCGGCEVIQLKDLPMPEGQMKELPVPEGESTEDWADTYKANIIAKHRQAMDGDEYYFAQVTGPAGAPINLDRNALDLLKEYYTGNRYDGNAYCLAITYSWDTAYVCVPCRTEQEAMHWLELYLQDEVATVRAESGYEPAVLEHSPCEKVIVYGEGYEAGHGMAGYDHACYKVMEMGVWHRPSSFRHVTGSDAGAA